MVKMTRITNEKTRVTTYKKRKACLYKKASEFSTLCGVDTCMIVYGPNKAGEEMVVEPEVWPRDESKVRDIISKYRDTLSSSCTKTFTVQECLEKSNKVEKPLKKYCPWDKKLDKCCLNELYAAFVAVGNKIQEATDRQCRNQTFPDQLAGFCGYNQQYNQQCLEQHQLLFPMPTMEHNVFPFTSLFNQMTSSNTVEMASFSNVTDPEMAQAMMLANGQNMFYGSCSEGQYGTVVQRTAYMDPMQWGLGSSVFTDYPLRFAPVNGLDDSGKICM